MIDARPYCIRFNKIDRFIRIYDGIIYLILFGSEKYDFIYNRIRYLVGVKSNYTNIKLDLHKFLYLEKNSDFS